MRAAKHIAASLVASFLLWAGAAAAQASFAAVQDSAGHVLGPLVDYRFMVGPPQIGFAAFSVEVGGKVAILQANRNEVIGGGVNGIVWFATLDCTGQAYVDWDSSWISPPSSIGGPLNTVYVGDVSPVVVHPTLQSRYSSAGGSCEAVGSSDAVTPVAAVGTLNAVAPFSLVPSGPALANAVPAASTWALAALAALLGGAALLALRRRAA